MGVIRVSDAIELLLKKEAGKENESIDTVIRRLIDYQEDDEARTYVKRELLMPRNILLGYILDAFLVHEVLENPDSFNELSRDLNQELLYTDTAGEKMKEEVFFELYTDELIDAGEIATANYCPYSDRSGRSTVRVDGYGGDPIESQDRTLTLIINDYSDSQEIETMDTARLAHFLANLNRFLLSVPSGRYKRDLDPHSQIYELMELIDARWDDIQKIRMLLITNRVFSDRANLENAIDRIEGGQLGGKDVSYTARDLRWLQKKMGGTPEPQRGKNLYRPIAWSTIHLRRFVESRINQDINPESYPRDFELTKNGQPRWKTRFSSALDYLVNKKILSKHYRQKGSRRVYTEQEMKLPTSGTDSNVRVYLSAKGKVNQALKSEYASFYELHPYGMWGITNIRKAIINNWGNLEFTSDHPFHIAMENFSRNVLVPVADNTFLRTKWFYERVGGQYVDAQANLTQAQRRAFQQEYPKGQKLFKSHLARYLAVWEGKPHMVSRGAQKNFVDFSATILNEWNQQSEQFNERYFHHAIAKAILFKETEKIVQAQPWYETGGYPLPIVAYAIAKLAHDLGEGVVGNRSHINFDDIWMEQELRPSVRKALAISATAVKDVITNPFPSHQGYNNVTEWAKREACWEKVKELSVNWNDDLKNHLIDDDMEQERRDNANSVQRALDKTESVKTLIVDEDLMGITVTLDMLHILYYIKPLSEQLEDKISKGDKEFLYQEFQPRDDRDLEQLISIQRESYEQDLTKLSEYVINWRNSTDALAPTRIIKRKNEEDERHIREGLSQEGSGLTDEELGDAAVVMFSALREITQDDVEMALNMLRLNPPFKQNWDRTQKLLKEKLGL